MMKVTSDARELLIHQIHGLYLECNCEMVDEAYPVVLKKLEKNFARIKNKYYQHDGEPLFNPLHVSQYTMFLYEMAREIGKNGEVNLADEIYGISKMLSSADIFYGVELPEIYFFDHPQGSVIGRANYSDYFSFTQGCTVGNNRGIYPSFGEHVSMMSGAKVLGNCHIGDHVILSANSYVIDMDIPPFSIVFGAGKDVVTKHISLEKFEEITGTMF